LFMLNKNIVDYYSLLLLLLRGHKLNEIINSENSDSSFGSEFKRLDLTHGGFEDTSLLVVSNFTVH